MKGLLNICFFSLTFNINKSQKICSEVLKGSFRKASEFHRKGPVHGWNIAGQSHTLQPVLLF